jgi:UV DNA damage endonuclease
MAAQGGYPGASTPIQIPRLGYACINNSLQYPKKRKDITCIIASVYKAGDASGHAPGTPEYSATVLKFLCRYGLKNTAEIIEILDWHVKMGMKFYRMSSDLFPHIDNQLLENYMIDEDLNSYRLLEPFRANIERIAEVAYQNGIRLTMHPDEYTVLASPKDTVVAATVRGLKWHALLFEIMEAYIDTKYGVKDSFKDSILCVHIGGRYDNLGGKSVTLERWKKNFRELLPDYCQKRVCVENCEKSYCAEDLLPLCQELNIPLIFDFHHYDCYPKYHKGPEGKQDPSQALLPRIIETWTRRGMTPKFHLSDQAPGLMIGAHDQFVRDIPDALLELAKEGKTKFDIMIEAKSKDYAVFYLLTKYPFFNNTNIKDPYSLIHKDYPNVPVRPIPVSYLLITGINNNPRKGRALTIIVPRKSIKAKSDLPILSDQ